MDRALSLLISAGITALGVWIVAYTMASGSPLGWTLMGILPIIPGSFSLYQAVGEVRLTTDPTPLRHVDEEIERIGTQRNWSSGVASNTDATNGARQT